ncbi:MAG TPA: DegV family protein [Acidimicrobiales bacterium]|nr:DegV family protein [Acidimicrobiales bacterium]
MAGIRVVTDSAGDLPTSLAEEQGIRIVPLDVRLGEWGPDEMRLIEPAEFWRRCAITSSLPETSAPSPGAFAESFAQAAEEGCSGVVCLTLSSGLSATYQAARSGADEVRDRIDVRVVDTRFVTLGEAMIVLEAAEVAAATNDLDAVEAAAHALVPRVRVLGALDTMENLRKGGRIGSAKALLGSLLSIKPIIEIRDGVVEAESRQRTRTRSLEYLAHKVKEAGKLEGLAVAHAAAPDLDVLLEMLSGTFPPEDIVVSYIGPVIGTHAGPGCIGVCYRLAEAVDG